MGCAIYVSTRARCTVQRAAQRADKATKGETMFKTVLKSLAGISLSLGVVMSAQAVVVTFTGGTMTDNSNNTAVTNNAATYNNVAKYEEAGFRVQFFGGSNPNSGFIGNYYGAGNDVIHGHWATGNFGALTKILITKIDGTAFDMNYFVLTSNTDTGGGAASGNEKAYIHASGDGVTDDYAQLLPVEDWGFPATQVFLGSQFDNVKAVWFDVANVVDCFGMDNFFIDQAAPGDVPEPGSLALVGLALFGLSASAYRRAR